MKRRIVAIVAAASLGLMYLTGCQSAAEQKPAETAQAQETTKQTSETTEAVTKDTDADTTQATQESSDVEIKEVQTTFYLASADAQMDLSLYMVGDSDVPYIDANLMSDMMNYFYSKNNTNGYTISYTADGASVEMERENGATCIINFDEDTVFFSDYDLFQKSPEAATLIDELKLKKVDAEGKPFLFQTQENSYERYGKFLTLSLADYEIDLIQSGEYYLIPLQTFSDLFLSNESRALLYNGESVFYGNMANVLDDKELAEIYYSNKNTTRSEALTQFTYKELCFALDTFYGLKEQHNITNFNTFFAETGLGLKLLSEDGKEAEEALMELAYKYLADKHTKYLYDSPYAGEGYAESVGNQYSLSYQKILDNKDMYESVRTQYLGDEVPGYQEVGNTAYVCFDNFVIDAARDYYSNPGCLEDGNKDTVALIQYAHSQIMRENSPIENVVIDLSANTGGMVDAAAYVLSWCLGEAPFSLQNTLSGAEVSTVYKADVNLDHEFDENDCITSKKIFCMTSPISFSCGNLVPAVFKNSDSVTLIGKKSAGGACSVYPLSCADGSVFRISGPYRSSFLWNGAYYDIDQGVEPDVHISSIEGMYDREALTEFVNSIY